MTCQPEKVTAYVDGALDPTLRADLEAHLQACPSCAEQLRGERAVREALRGLSRPELPAGLEVKVREGLRRARPGAWRVLLPLAAVLVLGFSWLRGNAFVLSWELALDHQHCFGKKQLPAQVWGQDADRIRAWFTAQGTTMPLLPEAANGLDLAGGRYCPLLDRKVAHLYYGNEERNLSLYVVPGPARLGNEDLRHAGGRLVQFLRAGGSTIALVGDDPKDLSSFRASFESTIARVLPSRTRPFGIPRPLTPKDRPDILLFLLPVGL